MRFFGLCEGDCVDRSGRRFELQCQRFGTGTATRTFLVGERLVDLEEAFWSCDYLVTTRGVADAVTCGAIYYVLKERKFHGDVDKLLSWWRQNRIAQHEKLALVGQP